MNKDNPCPVCLNVEGGSCRKPTSRDLFECDTCGIYKIDIDKLEGQKPDGSFESSQWELDPLQRAALSHRIRTRSDASSQPKSDPFEITSDVLDSFRSDGRLPSPAVQATNIIRFIGDEVLRSSKAVGQLPPGFHAIIGALNFEAAIRLTKELVKHQRLTANLSGAAGIDPATGRPFSSVSDINLSPDEWNQYEAKKRRGFDENYGFLAMKFDEDDLNLFVKDVVKPVVKENIGYDLVDMRDRKKAGILDEIMRGRIRDAKFVIVDLTHDNSGAYWEAGYAEGLDKPVIYICEKEKFERDRTHFNTNHCATVLWSRDDDEGFRQELTEIILGSLNES